MDVVNNHVIVFVLFPLSRPSSTNPSPPPSPSILISFCGTSFAPLTSLLGHPLGQNAAIMRPLNNSSRARIRRIHTHTLKCTYVFCISLQRYVFTVSLLFRLVVSRQNTGVHREHTEQSIEIRGSTATLRTEPRSNTLPELACRRGGPCIKTRYICNDCQVPGFQAKCVVN